MEPESYSLSSNEFPERVMTTMKNVYRSEMFADVTLISEDLREVRGHKLVLASGSKVLSRILSRPEMGQHQQVLYLRGILHDDLMSILQFIYLGEVTVAQERLASILQAAEDLKVYQLCGIQNNVKSRKVKDTVQNKSKDIVISSPKPLSSTLVKVGSSTPVKSFTLPQTSQLNVSKMITEDAAEELNEVSFDDGEDASAMDLKFNSEQDESVHGEDIKPDFSFSDDKSTIQCNQCEAVFGSKGAFNVHFKSKHLNIKHPCPQCNYMANNKGDLKRHVQNIHEGKKFPCPHCDHKSSCSSNLSKHIKIHEGLQYNCDLCDAKLSSKSNWKRHMAMVHKGEQINESI